MPKHKEMTPKEKRVMEAHRLRYMEDLSYAEIAKRIGVTKSTIENYFSQAESDKYKRFYSDQELFKLEQSLETDVRDGNKLANNLLARAIQKDDVGAKTLLRAAKEAQRIRERKVDLLQELGVIDDGSEGDGVEDGGDGFDELREQIAEGLRGKREEEGEEVEAE